jgi:tRNA(Ile)-lysidine synthase
MRVERGVRLIRPLLQISKSDLLEYLNRKKIAFLRDRSNLSDRFLRNRIRTKLLPDLRRLLNPRTNEHLADLAADAASWRAWSESWADTFINKHLRKNGRELIVGVDRLKSCPEPLRVAVYFKITATLTAKEQHLRREHVRQIESLLFCPANGERVLAWDVRIRRFASAGGSRIGWRIGRAR